MKREMEPVSETDNGWSPKTQYSSTVDINIIGTTTNFY
jgi:hypothetical protein